MRKSLYLAVGCLVFASMALAQKSNDPQPAGDGPGFCPQGATTLCIPLDDTFEILEMAATGGSGQADPSDDCQRNDDDSTLGVPLQFDFDFFGTIFNEVFVNNNGNVSFGTFFPTFTSTGFPIDDFPMIAPFWGDVDTGNINTTDGGVVWVKSESNRFTVIWDHVGYYNENFDKVNTFQLILTDGTDPLIGIGNNVCFCYDDMQWTTGDASGGSGGFGGSPATVGANLGDGVNFFLVGLFDHPGIDYDGPGGNNDGVDFLDNSTICFDVAESDPNAPPIFINAPDDCLMASVGVELVFDITAIAPELGQTATITVDSGGLANFSCNLTPGNPATASCSFTPDNGQVGAHVVTFTATDDGDPPASADLEVCILVAECYSVVGLARGDGEQGLDIGGHKFNPLVANVKQIIPVTLDEVARITVPRARFERVLGNLARRNSVGGPASVKRVFAQVLMYNPEVFPENDDQWTPGLEIAIDASGVITASHYGDRNGMDIDLNHWFDDNGDVVLEIPFAIDGM